MKQLELERHLEHWAEQGMWIVSARQIHVMFEKDSSLTFNKALKRIEETEVLEMVSPGLYLNHFAHLPGRPRERLIQYLRPWQFCYISFQSALYARGKIDEDPDDLLVMTTGRTTYFDTPLGGIRMVHTKRRGDKLTDGVTFDESRNAWVATVVRAKHDMSRIGHEVARERA